MQRSDAGRLRPRPADPQGPRRRRRAGARRSTSRTRTSSSAPRTRSCAAVPDLISLVEADSGQPLTTEGMRFGLRVHVVGHPVVARLVAARGAAPRGTQRLRLRHGPHPPRGSALTSDCASGSTSAAPTPTPCCWPRTGPSSRRSSGPRRRTSSRGVAGGTRGRARRARTWPRVARRRCSGTTQCTNAIVERRGLRRVGVLRIGAPATTAVPPLADWPADLREAALADARVIGGGHHFDGREIAPLDVAAVRRAAEDWQGTVRGGRRVQRVLARRTPATRRRRGSSSGRAPGRAHLHQLRDRLHRAPGARERHRDERGAAPVSPNAATRASPRRWPRRGCRRRRSSARTTARS